MRCSAPAAAIIAGGRARRFGGRDKSRLIVRGRPIIVRQVEELRRVTDEIFVVADDADRFSDLGIPVFRDRRVGVLGALATALASTATDRVLAVAADMPFLSAPLFEVLAARALDGDGAWVVTPRGPEPLVACYRQRALPDIRARLHSGRLTATDLGTSLDLRPVGPDDLRAFGDIDELLTNVNAPADHARIQ